MARTKAAQLKKLEVAYRSDVQVRRSSAHRSGVCLCRSMVGEGGQIEDVTTYVVSVSTASVDHRTVFCKECGAYAANALQDMIMMEVPDERNINYIAPAQERPT